MNCGEKTRTASRPGETSLVSKVRSRGRTLTYDFSLHNFKVKNFPFMLVNYVAMRCVVPLI
jgi:hypothetical protein